MRISKQFAAACVAATLTVLTATAARADIVYNTLDDSVDTAAESMTLYLDPGAAGVSELRILEQDAPDHPNCNINGDPWNLTVSASYDSSIVAIDFPDGLTLEECDSVLRVEVTPKALGSTSVVFSYTANVPSSSGNDSRTFDVRQADFDVTVLQGDGQGGGTVCDADPAAPAWAAALLKGNGVKAKDGGSNYVSSVAKAMGQRATFGGVEKSDHPGYEDAVWEYMKNELGLGLRKGPHDPAVIKPGWECTNIPGPSL